jgi:ABC-type transporter Mla subunit MlaD
MAFNAGAVRATLELSTKGFKAAVRTARKAIRTFGAGIKRVGRELVSFRRNLGLLRDLFIVIPGLVRAVTAPFRGLVSFLREASAASAAFETETQKLTTSLSLAGVRGAARATENLKEYASQVQDTTAFSDGMVLAVTQTLAVLGVQERDLEKATSAVLDYSAATGRDAINAAVQFGRTLSGLLGELGEAFPALRNLSQEALRNGGAFDFATQALGGFAKSLANTTEGLRAQFTNAFGDLQKAVGAAINPVLNEVTKLATSTVKEFRRVIQENEGPIREAFAGILARGADLLQGLPDFALGLRTIVPQVQAVVFEIVAAAQRGIAEVRVSLQEIVVAALELRNALPGFLGGTDDQDAVDKAVGRLGDLRVAVDKAGEGFRKQAEEARRTVLAIESQNEAIRLGVIETGLVAQSYRIAANFAGSLADNIREAAGDTQKLKEAAGGAEQAVAKTLSLWRNVNKTAEETNQAVGQVGDSTRDAAAGANELANALGRAAGAAASTSSSLGGGRGGSGRSGGSVRLVGATPEETAANLTNLERRLPFVNIGREAAANTVNQVRAALEGQLRQEVSALTADIVGELNRAGIFDPAERQRIVRERVGEAERFGIISSRSSLGLSGRNFA